MVKKAGRKQEQAAAPGLVAVAEAPAAGPGLTAITRQPRKYTLDEAFDYFVVPEGDHPGNCEFNEERCVRAVAYLLHYTSEMGNEDVQGVAAHGLGHVLETCATDMARTKGHRELTRPKED